MAPTELEHYGRKRIAPRRFVYRNASADTALPHPLRRATDDGSIQQIREQPEIHPTLIEFRVHLTAC